MEILHYGSAGFSKNNIAMLNIVILLITLSLAGYLAFSRRLSQSASWKATVTPLASIMGSGFLISAPLLAGVVGNLAIGCMAALLLLAYAIGNVIRFNIKYFEPMENDGHGAAQDLAFLSRLVLAGAYFISVTYYLKLLAAFSLNLVHLQSEVLASVVTTVILVAIGGIGMWRGLGKLERVETYAVSLNLGMIGALLVGLAVYNIAHLSAGNWRLPPLSSGIDMHDLRVLLGLLIVVQGFETSRYLGDEHPAEMRIRTMRLAQLVSAVIYLLFIALATILFHQGLGADVTAIINMTRPVAIVLPLLLSVAAIGSQFSAAVADTLGAGGLVEDITHHRLPIRYAYLLIMLVTVTLTWGTNVYSIIAYASRAFSLFYMLQCLVAVIVALQTRDIRWRMLRIVGYATIGGICLLVLAFGLPSE